MFMLEIDFTAFDLCLFTDSPSISVAPVVCRFYFVIISTWNNGYEPDSFLVDAAFNADLQVRKR